MSGSGSPPRPARSQHPKNTASALLFHLERGFGSINGERRPPDGDLRLRSAGERGEAEAIGTEVAKLIASGVEPDEVAVALRDPARRGPLIASVLESYGIATALEADLPVSSTAVGGGLIALLETEFGAARASDLLRFLRGPSGVSLRRVDWLERAVRRGRVDGAAAALELWDGEVPHDLTRVREAAAQSPAALLEEAERLVMTFAARHLRGRGDGPHLGPGDRHELRAAAAISGALVELRKLDGAKLRPADLKATIESVEFRAWSGPLEGRVGTASPYRLRAGRFDHVFVGSLARCERSPRRGGARDPFLSEGQRAALGLQPRRDPEAEERYLFSVYIPSLVGGSSSPTETATKAASPRHARRFSTTCAACSIPRRGERHPIRWRRQSPTAASWRSHPLAESPSEDALARAVAVRGERADSATLLIDAGVSEDVSRRVADRIKLARAAAAALLMHRARCPIGR